ncbi:MAG TPA: hypothetical protein VGM37_13100 [Armatimonadota bacterium]|jgi:hypothetical protein
MRSSFAAVIGFAILLPAHAQDTPPEVAAQIAASGVGAIVGLGGVDPLVAPALDARRDCSGGKLVYSGSPEYCPGPGILYQDTFGAGEDVRLYLYHVNASPKPLRFSVVLEPVGGRAHVDVENSIAIGPSRDYFSVGRLSAFIQLGRPTPPRPRPIDLSSSALLDADLDARLVPPGRPEPLIHGLYDFRVTSGTVRMSVVAVEGDADTLTRFPALTLLARDKHHDRGTYRFFTEDAVVAQPYSTADGVRHLRMADGVADPWMQGGDATIGSSSPYRGSYGVIYKVHLKLVSPDGRKVALVLNPRAGGLGGAVAVERPRHGKSADYSPSLNLRTVEEKEEAAVLAKWDPKTTPEVTVWWTPPGAASLPVEWILLPY